MVEAHIKDAVARGAKGVTGGKRSALGGSFFEPTLLAVDAIRGPTPCNMARNRSRGCARWSPHTISARA